MEASLISEITPQLYIGKARLATRVDLLREFGVASVVKLYHAPPIWPEGFTLLDAPFEDGIFIPSAIFQRCDQFISVEIAAGRSVVVVCGASISRSATVILSYLIHSGMEIREAHDLVRRRHPLALPHPELWRSLIAHHGLPYTLRDVLSWGAV